jgi:mRNA interferase MazF
VVIQRGAVFWVELGDPVGSAPAKRRPVVVVSADAFNRSRLRTVLAAAITSNTAVAAHPGNVFLPATATGLPKDSAVNVTQLVTLDRTELDIQESAGEVPDYLMTDVDAGLRLVLGL